MAVITTIVVSRYINYYIWFIYISAKKRKSLEENWSAMDNHELKALYEQYKKAAVSMVISISSDLGVRALYTEGHDQRTADYSMRRTRRKGLKPEETEVIYIGALLHDIMEQELSP